MMVVKNIEPEEWILMMHVAREGYNISAKAVRNYRMRSSYFNFVTNIGSFGMVAEFTDVTYQRR